MQQQNRMSYKDQQKEMKIMYKGRICGRVRQK